MNQEIKVTVLIPCYNASKFIHEAVDSIISQTHGNLEILLIDDGSTDNTRDIITEYAQQDKRVVPVFNEGNLGLIRTLNEGVKRASGKYLARMDADDISDSTRIEKLLNALLTHPGLDIVSAGFYIMSSSGKILRQTIPKALHSGALRFVSFFSTPVNHPCVMVKTEVFRDNKFDENFIHSEDYEIFSRLLSKGYIIMNLEQPLYYLRLNPESVSNRFEQIQISTHTRISERNILEYFGRRFDFFLHKVMINRINFNVNRKLLHKAIRTLEFLKAEFISRENLSPVEILEIRDFLIEQKIDIYLQSIKYARWWNKPALATSALLNLNLFLSKRGRNYVSSKINFLFSKQPAETHM